MPKYAHPSICLLKKYSYESCMTLVVYAQLLKSIKHVVFFALLCYKIARLVVASLHHIISRPRPSTKRMMIVAGVLAPQIGLTDLPAQRLFRKEGAFSNFLCVRAPHFLLLTLRQQRRALFCFLIFTVTTQGPV